MKSMQSLKPLLHFVSLAITFISCKLAKMCFCRKRTVTISAYDDSNLTFHGKKINWKFAGEGFLWRLQRCFQTESLAWPQQPVLTPPFIIVTIKSNDLCRAASWFNDKHSLQTTWLKVLFTDEGKDCQGNEFLHEQLPYLLRLKSYISLIYEFCSSDNDTRQNELAYCCDKLWLLCT